MTNRHSRPLTARRHGALLSVLFLCVLGVLRGGDPVFAQFQMPDMKQMSGIPRPVDDLPAGSLSVRLIRGSMSNNIAGHPVELHAGGKTQVVKTDESGRAQFDKIPSGTTVKASADVDGEHLESQEFPMPDKVGIRMMLVATDKNAAPATSPDATPVAGQVVIANQSRIVLEPAEEAVNVFYLLDISNTARVPVNPTTAFDIDLPKGADGAGIMEGSSPQASVANGRVHVNAPFAPGHTFVQVAYQLPVASDSLTIAQAFPASMEGLAVVVRKSGETRLESPQVTNQRDMPADGESFIAGTGGPVPAGKAIELTVSGLPHHSTAPRNIALALAVFIVIAAVWAGGAPTEDAAAAVAERKRVAARREKLMADLVRLEADHHAGRVDPVRYAKRREDIVSALELIYGALDTDEAAAEPSGRAAVPHLGAQTAVAAR